MMVFAEEFGMCDNDDGDMMTEEVQSESE